MSHLDHSAGRSWPSTEFGGRRREPAICQVSMAPPCGAGEPAQRSTPRRIASSALPTCSLMTPWSRQRPAHRMLSFPSHGPEGDGTYVRPGSSQSHRASTAPPVPPPIRPRSANPICAGCLGSSRSTTSREASACVHACAEATSDWAPSGHSFAAARLAPSEGGNATQRSSYLDDADQPQDYQNDDDHADDSYATTHLDLPFTK